LYCNRLSKVGTRKLPVRIVLGDAKLFKSPGRGEVGGSGRLNFNCPGNTCTLTDELRTSQMDSHASLFGMYDARPDRAAGVRRPGRRAVPVRHGQSTLRSMVKQLPL
jgi:hypothetical protein